MKTLMRILIILAAFTLIMGITYALVNAGSSSTLTSMPAFEGDGEERLRPEGMQPPFSDGERPEFDGDRHGLGGAGLIFGFAKNIAIIAIIVALVTVPKKLMQKKPARVTTL